MASLAQQESQSMSQNIKLGLQYRYQQGKVQVNHNRFLGYTKDDNGHLIIDPEQAEIVKRIYREYLKGSSMDKIADGLMADGILTGAGKTKWHTSTINKILRNEKYMGDALAGSKEPCSVLLFFCKNFFLPASFSAFWAFHVSRPPHMHSEICLPVCRNISVVAILAFIVSSLLLNAHGDKSDRKNHYESKHDKCNSRPDWHLYK